VYVKLFSQILNSSIWLEAGETRLVWITLLAAMDKEGFCQFAAPGNLANTARVSLEACTKALEILEGPDPHSSDPANEGRRIERVPGGWIVLNAGKYRALGTLEHKRAQTAERVKHWKRAQKDAKAKIKSKIGGNAKVTQGNAGVRTGNAKVHHADTDTHVDLKASTGGVSKGESEGAGDFGAEEPKPETPKPRTEPAPKRAAPSNANLADSVFIETLKANPAYSQIDIERELGKAGAWCEANHRVCTKRFFVNWINRAERPLQEANGNGGIVKQTGARRETTSERRWRETREYCEALNSRELDTGLARYPGLPPARDS